MTKKILAVLFIFLVSVSLSAEPVDMVVMLDTSESVLPIYDDLVNFIIKNILSDHVRFGDTFHLISFDSRPELIFSKQLNNRDDLEHVISELFLLNPLGKHTDLVMALKYLHQYVSDLSDSGSREIIILTDGIHDPPPGSPFQNIISVDEKTGEKINLLENEIDAISKYSWKVSLVKLPVKNGTSGSTGSTGSTEKEKYSEDNTSEISPDNYKGTDKDTGVNSEDVNISGSFSGDESTETADENNIFSFTGKDNSRIYSTDFNNYTENKSGIATGSPRIYYPENLGKVKYHFTLPVEIENFFSHSILLKLDRVEYNGINILDEKITIKIDNHEKKRVKIRLSLPYSTPSGENTINLKTVFTDSNRAFPETASVSIILKKSLLDFLKDINIVFKSVFIILIFAVLVVFFFIFFRSFVHVSIRDSYNVIKKDFEVMVSDKSLRPVALKVTGQNDRRIGSRNIHNFNDNSIKTIGGGHSSYLIFLYQIPSHIAEIYHLEGKYILHPVKREYFPDIKEDTVEDIINKKFRIVTEKGIILECCFYEYVSPLEEINRIMKLTDSKGLPENRLKLYTT